MRQTGGSRYGYHPFLLDICCANDLATAFRGLARFLGRSGLWGQVAAGPRRFFAQRRPAQFDETTAIGRYQVVLYDNNFGAAESYPKFDWGQLGAAVVTDYSKGTHSFGRVFAVDETARTYELEDQIAVPFSGYVGNSNSMLVASGQAKTFTEYDRCGLPIATYEMEAEKYIYRVYKYKL